MSHEVCVEGFPPSISEDEFRHLFSACGTVLSVDMAMGVDGRPWDLPRCRWQPRTPPIGPSTRCIISSSTGVPCLSFLLASTPARMKVSL